MLKLFVCLSMVAEEDLGAGTCRSTGRRLILHCTYPPARMIPPKPLGYYYLPHACAGWLTDRFFLHPAP